MPKRTYEVLQEYDPKKHGELTKMQSRCLSLMKQGDIFEPKDLINDNMDYLSTFVSKNKKYSASHTVFDTLKIAKGLGIIREVDDNPVSFDEFCQIESISYFADQLRGSKNKNLEEKRKVSSTKKDYLYRIWEFNNWLHGKAFEFKTTVYLSDTTFETRKEMVTLEGLDHLLTLYKNSFNADSDYIRVIKRFLNDETHKKCSVSYMKLKHTAISAFFEKNECDLRFKYDPNIRHQNYSEESSNSLLTLDDLGAMIRTGKASPLDCAVVLCKFQRGLDNSTLVDRFNYQVWEQLVKYFGTEVYESWDLRKCPVPIKLTRVKTNYTHTGYLDYDAVDAIQKYLKIRYEKTGKAIKPHEPLFLNSRRQPISQHWVTSLIPRLAENSGIQKKVRNSEITQRNEKTSHELRDLLKSTLVVEGVADYVCELAIGHKIGDSYEKMDKLYPERSRIEYAKASHKLNIVSKMKSSLDDELIEKSQIDKVKKEFEAKIAEMKSSNEEYLKKLDESKNEVSKLKWENQENINEVQSNSGFASSVLQELSKDAEFKKLVNKHLKNASKRT